MIVLVGLVFVHFVESLVLVKTEIIFHVALFRGARLPPRGTLTLRALAVAGVGKHAIHVDTLRVLVNFSAVKLNRRGRAPGGLKGKVLVFAETTARRASGAGATDSIKDSGAANELCRRRRRALVAVVSMTRAAADVNIFRDIDAVAVRHAARLVVVAAGIA